MENQNTEDRDGGDVTRPLGLRRGRARERASERRRTADSVEPWTDGERERERERERVRESKPPPRRRRRRLGYPAALLASVARRQPLSKKPLSLPSFLLLFLPSCVTPKDSRQSPSTQGKIYAGSRGEGESERERERPISALGISHPPPPRHSKARWVGS